MSNLLDKINFPSDLRKIDKKNLKQVSEELEKELIDVVSGNWWTFEGWPRSCRITVALHYVFNTPKDKLVWDVSHQCYPHKIIAGRKE